VLKLTETYDMEAMLLRMLKKYRARMFLMWLAEALPLAAR
jgi:hypothetical protein